MKIKKLGISNFKSFDSEGVLISLEKKINIFIGKNNSGKSNILKFLKLFSEYYKELHKFPVGELENQHLRNGQNPILKVTLNLAEIWKQNADILGSDNTYSFNFSLPNFEIVGEHPLGKFSQYQLVKFQTHYSSASKDTLLKTINSNLVNEIRTELNFLENLIYVPHFREISNNNDSNSIFNGNFIIKKLFEMKNPGIGEEQNKVKFEKIQSFLRQLLAEENLYLDIPHTKDRIIIEINGNRLSLESLGTGIHELVILCSALTLFDNYTFCIEEPELHLHPELQRKFISYIQTFNNFFFITTHSNVFIEYNPQINIYKTKLSSKSTKIVQVTTNKSKFEILDDLGYKASDILQSNGIIWVEGPSDRIYLTKWLHLINHNLIEGIHYTIMFYGGRLLAHLTFSENNELINLLRINRNAVVIIDRDGISPKSRINSTKKRINDELGRGNCWITKGREIENYLTEATVNKYLLKEKNNIKFKYSSDTKFENNFYNSKRSHKFKYELQKVKYAKEIAAFITKDDIKILDLENRIEFISKQINIWNK